MKSHLTSSHLTVFRRIWTPPTGFMTIAATRSEETAAVGVTPKKIRRMGVMRAPPPIPVRPTVNPTITDASAMDQSMCTAAKDTPTPEEAPDHGLLLVRGTSATVAWSCRGGGPRESRSPLEA